MWSLNIFGIVLHITITLLFFNLSSETSCKILAKFIHMQKLTKKHWFLNLTMANDASTS